jgi:hypothetical protein
MAAWLREGKDLMCEALEALGLHAAPHDTQCLDETSGRRSIEPQGLLTIPPHTR